MKLITIILALLVGRFFSDFISYRRFGWFIQHVRWVEKNLSEYGIWNSQVGVVLVLFIPAAALLFLMYCLEQIFFGLPFIFSIIVLFLCLGHEQLTDNIEDYIDADEEGDDDKKRQIVVLIDRSFESSFPTIEQLLGSVFNQSNRRIFAVLFWFVVLGPLGALLYRLTFELYREQKEIHGRFSDSVSDLHQLLSWPAIRLTVISFALVGSLVHTFESWRDNEQGELDANDKLLESTGLAAIQYSDRSDVKDGGWLDDAHGLINRSLLLWLTVIAFGTISGWLS